MEVVLLKAGIIYNTDKKRAVEFAEFLNWTNNIGERSGLQTHVIDGINE